MEKDKEKEKLYVVLNGGYAIDGYDEHDATYSSIEIAKNVGSDYLEQDDSHEESNMTVYELVPVCKVKKFERSPSIEWENVKVKNSTKKVIKKG